MSEFHQESRRLRWTHPAATQLITELNTEIQARFKQPLDLHGRADLCAAEMAGSGRSVRAFGASSEVRVGAVGSPR
jgi:hypothetical protein